MPPQEIPIPLLSGDKIESSEYRDALPVNFTAVIKQIRGADGYVIVHPGLTSYAVVPGKDRGATYNERFETQFRVSGTRLIEILSDASVSDHGGIAGSDQASLAQSFNTQAIVAGGKYFLYDPTNGFREVTDPDLGDPIDLTWIDNYYFFTDGEFIYHTDITDESSIDPLKFATSEFSPDKTLGVMKTQDNQVAVFNRFSTEWFINRATENFAFARLAGQGVKCGIVGTHCKTELEGFFFVLGSRKDESPTFHIISPGNAKSFSTREVDKILAGYAEPQLQGVVLETRVQERDKFIIAHLPSHTLIYNHTIAAKYGADQAWTILNGEIGSDAPWPGKNGVYDARVSEWIYGDRGEARIGRLDLKSAKLYDDDIEFFLYTPMLAFDASSIDQVQIDTVPGFTDNKVTVAMSRSENGQSYGEEFWTLYSQKNVYNDRYIVRRVGYVTDYASLRFRGVTGKRLAFSNIRVTHG